MKPIKNTLLNKAIGYFSPQTALNRYVARQKMHYFEYDAGRAGRERSVAARLQTSESSRNQIDRMQMLRRSRDLADNVGFVKSILLKMATYVAGTVKYQARTGDRSIDEQYESYFNDWQNVADLSGRHTFLQLVQLAVISMIRDGDIGFITIRKKGEMLKLQPIEADRIGSPYEAQTIEKYFSGITVNDIGQPISYRIYQVVKDNSYTNPFEVRADSFIHLFDPWRVDQYRGITAFHAAINSLQDIKEILEFEKIAVKWASAQAGVVTNSTGSDESGYNFDTSEIDPNNNILRTATVEPGAINYLLKGESFQSFSYDRPSPAFNGFLQLLYREICLSLNLPYGFVYDMTNLSGPTARMESAQAQRAFQRLQCLLVDKLLNRTKNLVIADAIENKKLPISKNWMAGKWMFPAHPTIDVGRESRANLEENRQGLKSASDIYAEQGKDVDEEFRQIATEARMKLDLAEEFDVPVTMISSPTPNLTPELLTPQPPDIPVPEDGTGFKRNGHATSRTNKR